MRVFIGRNEVHASRDGKIEIVAVPLMKLLIFASHLRPVQFGVPVQVPLGTIKACLEKQIVHNPARQYYHYSICRKNVRIVCW